MLSRNVQSTTNKKGKSYILDYPKKIFKQYNYAIVNLECVLTNSSNSVNKEIVLKADKDWAKYLKKANITHANLANNHSLDFGEVGLEDAYNSLISSGIIPTGYSQKPKQSCEPVIIENKISRIAIFSSLLLPVKDTSCVICNEDIIELKERILLYKARNKGTKIFINLHWGVEYTQNPTYFQRKQAQSLIDVGADVIVGHHPHVVQQIECYKNKPIFYSLGNLVFDQQRPGTKKGIIAGFSIKESGDVETEIIPYKIEDCRPVEMSFNEQSAFVKILDKRNLNTSISVKEQSYILNYKEEYTNKIYGKLEINDDNFSGTAVLQKMTSIDAYKLEIKDTIGNISDKVMFRHNVYRFEKGDVNNNGKTNIILGVIKKTTFDPEMKKRLFVLRIDEGKIRPLWLGSNVCRKLVDFTFIKRRNGKNRIKTIEKQNNGLYCVGEYEWKEFGITLINYTSENINLYLAYKLL